LIGFGGTAGYDSTLNGKVLDLAHGVSRAANANLFMAKSVGLPYGPYNPKYNAAY
jgi:hypothetical protein